MALTTFKDALGCAEDLTVTTDKGTEYIGLFSDIRVDRNTLPDGWNAYDIRDFDSLGIPCEIKKGYVCVNHFGTFLIFGVIPELEDDSSRYFRIDPEEWIMAHKDEESDEDDDDIEPCPENYPTDWEYSFS